MAGKVTRKGQAAFLIGVAAGHTVKDAAAGAGISERQGLRRVEDPGFRQEVSRLRAEMFGRAAGRLAEATVSAAGTLTDLLSVEAPATRLAAARTLLEMASKYRESLELEARLRRLEEVAEYDRNQVADCRAEA